MFVAKLKKIAAVVMAALVLTAGVGAWRFAAAGPGEDRPQEKPVLYYPAVDAAQAPKATAPHPIPAAKRLFRIDLHLTQVKEGQRNLVATPRLITLEGSEGFFGLGRPYGVSVGGGQVEKINKGATVKVKVQTDEEAKLVLDMTLSQPAIGGLVEIRSIRVLRLVEPGQPSTVKLQTGDNLQDVLEVTASIQEAENEEKNTIAAAEKDLKTAESHRRAGRSDSARFYYELLRQHYPDTIYAERAKERLAELKKQKEKPPARVGQIFLRGNKKIADKVIMKEVALFPGKILTYPDLDIAERKLSQLKGLKSAEVSVIEREGDNTFKDIQITVEEK